MLLVLRLYLVYKGTRLNVVKVGILAIQPKKFRMCSRLYELAIFHAPVFGSLFQIVLLVEEK